MKAKIHGIEVEGTMEEILKMKDELDKREEVKHTYKIVYHHHYTSQSQTGLDKNIAILMREYPHLTWI